MTTIINTGVVVPSSPADRQAIKNALSEISSSFTRIEAEKELIKDIMQAVKDNQGIPPKYLRKIAKIYHKQNMNEVQQENEDIETLYDTITNQQKVD